MKAVYASTVNHADPLAALAVGESSPNPGPPVLVDRFGARGDRKPSRRLVATGVGLAAEQTPMILGTDAVGILDGHPRQAWAQGRQRKWCCTRSSAPMAQAWPRARRRTILSEIPRHDGREDFRAVRQRVRQARKPHHGWGRPHSAPAG